MRLVTLWYIVFAYRNKGPEKRDHEGTPLPGRPDRSMRWPPNLNATRFEAALLQVEPRSVGLPSAFSAGCDFSAALEAAIDAPEDLKEACMYIPNVAAWLSLADLKLYELSEAGYKGVD